MKKRILLLFKTITLLLVAILSNAQSDPAALQSWKDQKYSMFIHWGGIYSVLGGVWKGQPVSRGLSEQIQAHAGIYSDTYAKVAKQFNPELWNADSVVLLAKRAGMRSIVITTKHHDGFCMFKTNTTDFNVVDATPFKKDVVRDLSEACKRHGIRLGLYFSLIDWRFPQAMPISSHNSDQVTPELHEYNKKQVTELLSNYGTISELWFDMGSQSIQQSKELRDLVHKLQPNCMVSSRLGNDMGDFNVMGDNQEPDYIIGVPWQSPASFFDETWGYRSWQKRGSEEDKFNEKLTSLIKVVSRGGNYLLNIGPKGDGSVVDFEKNVLLKIGAWLNRNAEAIYGTGMDPFHVAFDWGQVTSRPDKLYLHLLKNPEQGTILLPGIKGKISKIYVLDEKEKTAIFKESKNGITITVPKNLKSGEGFKVLAVEFKNGYTVDPANVVQASGNELTLNGHNAFKYYSNSGIDYNSRFKSTVKEVWTLQSALNTNLSPYLIYSNQEKGKEIDVTFNNKVQTVKLDGEDALVLENDLMGLTWGHIYLAGPFSSGIDEVPGKIGEIDPSKGWPGSSNKPWEVKSNWKNDVVYSLPAETYEGYYLLQDINSPKDQSILVEITSGDGVLVMLNGKEFFVHNNPAKAESQKDIIMLPLKSGKNQLLVKVSNTFKKNIPVSINTNIQQVLYRKALDRFSLQKMQFYPLSWQLHNAPTLHQTLNLPNLSLKLQKK